MSRPTAARLAAEFADVIRCELTEEELAEAVAKNATPGYAGCCATHDYIDANMSMLTAYASVAGVAEDGVDFSDDAVLALWNEAWDIAKAAGFANKVEQ